MMVGILMAGSLAGNDPVKGWLAGGIGMMVAQVGLDPAAGIVEVGVADPDADLLRFQDGGDGDTGPALGGGLRLHHVPVLAGDVLQQLLHDLARGADLLQGQHVDTASGEPRAHALAVGGTDAVDVHGGHAQCTGRLGGVGVGVDHGRGIGRLGPGGCGLARFGSGRSHAFQPIADRGPVSS